jgi:endogenous inhibitor of DNA gyrase (YacG/DUF329 family)
MAAKKETKKVIALRCPTCREIVLQSDADFPFCSDRCKRIDLGKWASGVYKISSPALDPEMAEEIERQQRQQQHEDD